jgi:hypothetical protein
MSKKRKPVLADPELEPENDLGDQDVTSPDMGEGAVLASVDQYEAEVRGEANEPPKEEPVPEKEPEEKEPEEDLGSPVVSFEVFSKVHGAKWDQLAGFKNYAKRQKMKPRSVLKWREAYQAFLQKPV